MKIEFKETKIINSCNINVDCGSFALDEEPLKFENCRERFAVSFTPYTSAIFFKHSPLRSSNVASFIIKTEEILELQTKSEFALTNRNFILWISPSSFWKKCYVRRSLFTILLRAGDNYDSDLDNYEEALFHNDYVFSTKSAVLRFLFGFTEYTGPDIIPTGSVQTRGWRAIFQNKDAVEIKKLLRSPNNSLNIQTNIFPNSIWI